MKGLVRKALILTAAFAALGYMAKMAAAEDLPARITIGVDAAWRPFAFLDETGKLSGFDVDLSNALCAKMKIDCTIQNTPWDGIFAALETGKIDAIVSGINVTKEREEKYGFAGPYFLSPFAWMVTASSPIDGSIASLKGKTIGTLTGTPMEAKAAELLGAETTVRSYDTIDNAVLDLDSARIDAVISEEAQLRGAFLVKGGDRYRLVGDRIPAYPKGIALRKDATALTAAFDKAIDEIAADGTHAAISTKYFGAPLAVK